MYAYFCLLWSTSPKIAEFVGNDIWCWQHNPLQLAAHLAAQQVRPEPRLFRKKPVKEVEHKFVLKNQSLEYNTGSLFLCRIATRESRLFWILKNSSKIIWKSDKNLQRSSKIYSHPWNLTKLNWSLQRKHWKSHKIWQETGIMWR